MSHTLKRPTTISLPSNDSSSMTATDTPTSYTDNRNSRLNPFFQAARVSLTRSPHQESYAKMQQEDEDEVDKPSIAYISDKRTPTHQQPRSMFSIDEDAHLSDDNQEMILTAAKLTPLIIASPASAANTSRC